MQDEATTNRRVRAACRAEIYKLTGWLRRLPPYHPMRAELEGALAGQERELADLEARLMAVRPSLRANLPTARAFEVASLPMPTDVVWEALAEEMPAGKTPVAIRTVGDRPVEDLPVPDLPVPDLPVQHCPVQDRPVQDRPVQIWPAEDPFAQVASAQAAFAQDKFVHHPPAAGGFEPLASLPVRNMMAARAHADPSMLAASTKPVPALRAFLSKRVMGPLRFAGRTLTGATSDAIELVRQAMSGAAKGVQAATRAVFGVLAFCIVGVMRGMRLIGIGIARGLAAVARGLARATVAAARGVGRAAIAAARSVWRSVAGVASAVVARSGSAGAKGLRWVNGACAVSARGIARASVLCRDVAGRTSTALVTHGGRAAQVVGSRTAVAARVGREKFGSAGAKGLRWVQRACTVSARGIVRACIFGRDVAGRGWAVAIAHGRRAAWATGSATKAGVQRAREGWAAFHPKASKAVVRWSAKAVIGFATLFDMTDHGVRRLAIAIRKGWRAVARQVRVATPKIARGLAAARKKAGIALLVSAAAVAEALAWTSAFVREVGRRIGIASNAMMDKAGPVLARGMDGARSATGVAARTTRSAAKKLAVEARAKSAAAVAAMYRISSEARRPKQAKELAAGRVEATAGKGVAKEEAASVIVAGSLNDVKTVTGRAVRERQIFARSLAAATQTRSMAAFAVVRRVSVRVIGQGRASIKDGRVKMIVARSLNDARLMAGRTVRAAVAAVRRMVGHGRAETPVKAITMERPASDVRSDMDGKLA